jgi:hypothetical protein
MEIYRISREITTSDIESHNDNLTHRSKEVKDALTAKNKPNISPADTIGSARFRLDDMVFDTL